jgi:hypothetical protein
MADAALPAHSLAEAYLFFMVAPCPRCDHGPLDAGTAKVTEDFASHTTKIARIQATCRACARAVDYDFRLPADGVPRGADPVVVNPADEPSRLIDVGQWLTLFRVMTEAASRECDRVQARHLGLEAAQCLEEALKFYTDSESDFPPPEAFFHDASRKRFYDHPKQFSRERLVDLRAKLPTQSAMRASLVSPPQPPKKKPWWRWRR